jgi:hypothetical protein
MAFSNPALLALRRTSANSRRARAQSRRRKAQSRALPLLCRCSTNHRCNLQETKREITKRWKGEHGLMKRRK